VNISDLDTDLTADLTPPEQQAVSLLAYALDQYNTYDGVGVLEGPTRFVRLEDRVRIAALQSDRPRLFWDKLAAHMRWPAAGRPETLLALLRDLSPDALQLYRTQTQTLILLARHVHDTHKRQRRQGDDAS